jgi:hypothetical protein
MYPIGSNGTSQAMVDAEILAKHLKETEDVGTATLSLRYSIQVLGAIIISVSVIKVRYKQRLLTT